MMKRILISLTLMVSSVTTQSVADPAEHENPGIAVEVSGIFTMLPDHIGGRQYTLRTDSGSIELFPGNDSVKGAMGSIGQLVPVVVTGFQFASGIRVLSIAIETETYMGTVHTLPDHHGGIDLILATDEGDYKLIANSDEVQEQLLNLNGQAASIEAFTRPGEEQTLYVVGAE